MIPPPAFNEARLRARYHVQVELDAVEEGSTWYEVPVRGQVGRVFHGDDLRPGDFVRFSVPVCSPKHDSPFWNRWYRRKRADVAIAEYMEVFLNGTPPDCKVAGEQCVIIGGYTETPHLSVPTEAEVAKEWRDYGLEPPTS